ncbi:MAG: hypothetical protein WCO60_13505 [Verrucomicrobiota bacterium]
MRDERSLYPDEQPSSGSRWFCLVTNLFLLGFLLHGILAFTAFLTALPLPFRTINLLRDLSFLGTAGLMIILILLIGSYRQFPWGALVPSFVTVVWIGSYYMPLPGILEWKNTEFVGSIITIIVSIWTFMRVRQFHGNWFIPEPAFTRVKFSLARTFRSILVKLFILVPAYIVFVSVSCFWMLEWRGHGFIHIRAEGLTTETRVYKSGDKSVYLLPTVHIAAGAFYNKLLSDVPKQRAVVLPEGVTDKKKLLESGLSYKGAAQSTGLAEQPDFRKLLPSDGRHYDSDVSDFSPDTLATLQVVSTALRQLESSSLSQTILTLGTLPQPNLELLKRDILDARNARISFGIMESLSAFDNILVPWGALHMPGIETELLKSSFKQASSKEVLVFAWRDILTALLTNRAAR